MVVQAVALQLRFAPSLGRAGRKRYINSFPTGRDYSSQPTSSAFILTASPVLPADADRSTRALATAPDVGRVR
jgi:hypothetical protein